VTAGGIGGGDVVFCDERDGVAEVTEHAGGCTEADLGAGDGVDELAEQVTGDIRRPRDALVDHLGQGRSEARYGRNGS
jgi:hypothetical protein